MDVSNEREHATFILMGLGNLTQYQIHFKLNYIQEVWGLMDFVSRLGKKDKEKQRMKRKVRICMLQREQLGWGDPGVMGYS